MFAKKRALEAAATAITRAYTRTSAHILDAVGASRGRGEGGSGEAVGHQSQGEDVGSLFEVLRTRRLEPMDGRYDDK